MVVPPRTARTARIAAVLAAAVLLAACQPVPYSSGTGPRVFHTGDSVIWDSDALVSWGFYRSGLRTAGATFPGTEIGWSADRIMEQVWGDGGRQAPGDR